MELIRSAPVQRLKRIRQGGASYLVNPKWNVTRYEHSVGVMLLIRKLGGSLEEQIAGLLHDVSHTAFSHVIDYVLQRKDEDYHESIFMDVINRSEIPAILADYGFDSQAVFQAEWGLLERPLPELCADRIDYTLRDMWTYGIISSAEVQRFLASLTVHEGLICVDSIEAAEWFADTFYKEVIEFFLHPLNVYGYDRLAEALTLALQKGVLSEQDLMGDDETVLHKMKNAGDREIGRILSQIHPEVEVEENEADYDLHRKLKERVIDPAVLFPDGTRKRASVCSPFVGERTQSARQKAAKGVRVKVLRS
ncbi:HD domain-containing protein [Brevibacillus sp. SYP-B805]|uniref:HD domain-containing protein n=1 Tax=Brevibacillus sp. SYP-B805 TaxID=1578199 RepID=UPI0013EC67BB|nr:HD domain-containing protein [Brevibacillus sp. SYP-B805]NGQ96179.1 HD domain-containing protein [Brevibacillus sp. SYP-B805]